MSSKTIELLTDIVAGLGQGIPIFKTEILTATTQKVTIEESYWSGLYFKVGYNVTIDGTAYPIASITDCEYIVVTTVSGAALISSTGTLDLRAPQFVHGKVDLATKDVQALMNPTLADHLPIIYLVEPYNYTTNLDPMKTVGEESDVTLYFLDVGPEGEFFNTDSAYDNVIVRMEKLANAFYSALLHSPYILRQALEQSRIKGTGHVKVTFDKTLFPTAFAGVERGNNLPIIYDCCGNIPPVGECPTFSHLMEVNTAGTIATELSNLDSDKLSDVLQALPIQTINDSLTLVQKNQLFPVMPIKTFQLTSIYTGDDGETEYGRGGATVLLLPTGLLNPYGTNNRFTDSTGQNPFVDDIRIDWLNGLMWYSVLSRPVMNLANALVDAAAFSYLGFTDWRIPNENEFKSIRNQEGLYAGGVQNPFSYGVFTQSGGLYWLSTGSNIFNGGLIMNSAARIEPAVITNTYHVPLVRTLTDADIL